MKIKISADSTCDLSAALVQQYDIEIVPLCVSMDGNFYRDGLEITAEDIFRYVRETGRPCSTAAVNVEEYAQVFARLKENNDAVIHFTISSSMSSCYQNACIVAEEYENVYVIDSESLSTGIGQLVLSAAIMARNGMQAQEIVALINEKKKKLDVSFVLDTLEYLRKGGRCTAVAALGANLLGLKPCIEVHNGAMGVGKKYRGNFDKCLESYVRERLAKVETLDLERIFITYSSMPQERADRIRTIVAECAPFEEILMTDAGCTISSHCGPNCLGILFLIK